LIHPIYILNKITHQIKHKLRERCSKNPAEQMVIYKALQAIDTIKISNKTPRTVMTHTNRRIILESLKNMKNRHQLIEEIKKRLLHWTKKTGT